MKPCKEKLPNGKPCPNQADEGQKYCFFHLASQVAMPRKALLGVLGVLGILGVGRSIAHGGGVVKAVVKTVVDNFKRI
jgi:hypothetical protein